MLQGTWLITVSVKEGAGAEAAVHAGLNEALAVVAPDTEDPAVTCRFNLRFPAGAVVDNRADVAALVHSLPVHDEV